MARTLRIVGMIALFSLSILLVLLNLWAVPRQPAPPAVPDQQARKGMVRDDQATADWEQPVAEDDIQEANTPNPIAPTLLTQREAAPRSSKRELWGLGRRRERTFQRRENFEPLEVRRRRRREHAMRQDPDEGKNSEVENLLPFKEPRSDGMLKQMKDHPIPTTKLIYGATKGDITIDRTLPVGVSAALGRSAKFTPEELLAKHGGMDLVYTWVNGSEVNHMFKKYKVFAKVHDEADRGAHMRQHGGKQGGAQGVPSIEEFLKGHQEKIVNGRDRESGELMYSIRSLEKFMSWHRGRYIIVSPGHIPYWLDRSVLFMGLSPHSSSTGGSGSAGANSHPFQEMLEQVASSTGGYDFVAPRRIKIVHQDSLLPYDQRETFNTNTIEPTIWRIPELTNLFVQFNDDYMVGSETSVSDFVNDRGGPILLFEKNVIRGGLLTYQRLRHQRSPKTWIAGVFHANALTTKLLDSTIQDSVLDVLGRYLDREKKPSAHPKRLFIKHSPFVYCKQMQEYLYSALRKELTSAGLENKFRNYSDVVEPFLHHNVILDAPWRGSRNYIDSRLKKEGKENAGTTTTTTSVKLDGDEACAPALGKMGDVASSRLMVMTDNLSDNKHKLDELRVERPTFFALNDGFTKSEVPVMIRSFLQQWFPKPSKLDARQKDKRLERLATTILQQDPKSRRQPQDSQSSLPSHKTGFVFVISEIDYLCPTLRSMQLALPDFDGNLHFIIQQDQPEDEGKLDDLVKESRTMDTPEGGKTGLEDPDHVSAWIAVCHFNPRKVHLHWVGAAWKQTEQAKYQIWQSTSSHGEQTPPAQDDGKKVPPTLLFLTTSLVNPVFGQTLALEDFRPVQVGGSGGEEKENHSSSTSSRTIAVLQDSLVSFIDGPSAYIRLHTYPLPYRRYERVPWDQEGDDSAETWRPEAFARRH